MKTNSSIYSVFEIVKEISISIISQSGIVRNSHILSYIMFLSTCGALLLLQQSVPRANANQPDTSYILVIDSIPHDTSSFTQGLEINNSLLYESTGRYGHSSIRILDLETGNLILNRTLPDSIFAEGITFHENTLYQLTWKNGLLFTYEPDSLILLETLRINTAGWGICAVDSLIVTSDGSSILSFRSSDNMYIQRSAIVTCNGIPQEGLNELEYANGYIYANQWPTDRILKINPVNGLVETVFIVNHLPDVDIHPYADVPNGIAWDSESGVFLITGKLWPFVYITRFVQE